MSANNKSPTKNPISGSQKLRHKVVQTKIIFRIHFIQKKTFLFFENIAK